KALVDSSAASKTGNTSARCRSVMLFRLNSQNEFNGLDDAVIGPAIIAMAKRVARILRHAS
ncbi:MAG: hypothetical protein AAFY44_08675, partial [Pseudomonadota bacterium]